MIARTFSTLLPVLLCWPFAANAQTTEYDGIPASACGAVLVRFSDALAQPSMELFPREIMSAYGQQEWGFDPAQITSLTLLVDSIEDLDSPPGFAAILKFNTPQTLSPKITGQLDPGELHGKPVYRAGDEAPVFFLPDAKTIIVGMEPFIDKIRLASDTSTGPLASLVSRHPPQPHFQLFFVMDSARKLMVENLPPVHEVPPPLQAFVELPELIAHLVIEVDLSDESPLSQLKIGAIDESAAERIDQILGQAMTMSQQMILAQISEQMANESPEMRRAVMQYGNRLGTWLQMQLKPQLNGTELVFQSKDEMQMTSLATVGVVTGLLLPAVQQVREAARRTESINNMRQIAIACLNYESAYRQLPGNIVSDDGQPLLSWRVAILPFIEENGLYEQFHLNEPWDSPHNIQLLGKMPMIFQNSNVMLESKTVYQGFKGPGTVFSGERIRFRDIVDGSSNTILCVESDMEAAVEWSRPVDLPFGPDGPLENVGNLRPDGFNAAFCDGSTRFISRSVDPELLRYLIQINDGNIATLPDE